ncbi:metaxin-1-like [Diaphorina citri]|uniref:Metaxin-1-like n=1 Tax=Diaphorina citri TaxID=121845 RepID=A0A3Q0JBL2_DIACI|nr:metaxin-1-like [Diaphorina citri]
MGAFYKPMELEIWSPDWQLPSIDIDCLYVLAYAQFSNIKLEVKCTNNPFKSSSSTLPVFHHYKHHLTDINKIVEYFKSKGHDADGELSSKDKSEIIAYETMLREKLYPAIQYTLLCTINKFEQKRKKQEKEQAEKQKSQDLDFPHSLRNSILAGIFATCAMTGYAVSIGLIKFEQKRKKQEKEQAEKQKSQDLDFPHSLRNSILAAIFATCAMTGYAVSIGLISVSLRNK